MSTPSANRKNKALKGLATTLAVVLPGGLLLGAAYLFANRYQAKRKARAAATSDAPTLAAPAASESAKAE